MARAEPIPDHELPDELPEQFVGTKIIDVHYNFGRDGGAGLYTWLDKDGRAWPIQEQYDTRKPKAATKTRVAFEPSKTGVVIRDASQPTGFYGEVVSSYRELREVWKRWRAEKKQGASSAPAEAKSVPAKGWPFPSSAHTEGNAHD